MTNRADPPQPASNASSDAPPTVSPTVPSTAPSNVPSDVPSDESSDTQVNPDHEYEDATESKLDHTKPPRHEKTVTDGKHKTETQISVGKP